MRSWGHEGGGNVDVNSERVRLHVKILSRIYEVLVHND